MSQHLLHMADVCAVIQHMRGHRMAEQMATTRLLDVGLLLVVTDLLVTARCHVLNLEFFTIRLTIE
jgi:signal transduction histidine kinase